MRGPGDGPIGARRSEERYRRQEPAAWSAAPATGVRITWYNRFATDGDIQRAERSSRRFATAGAVVMLIGAAAQAVRLLGIDHPAVTHRLWYQLCLWVGIGLLVAAALAVAAVLAADRRRKPTVAPPPPRPGDLWISEPGFYLGPFGDLRGWRGCADMRPVGRDPQHPEPGDADGLDSGAGDPEVPAWLAVTERGVEIRAGDGGSSISSSWAGLRSVSVHFSFVAGEPSWVGLTTIDNRYARFRGRKFVEFSETLERLGASIRYEKETGIRVL